MKLGGGQEEKKKEKKEGERVRGRIVKVQPKKGHAAENEIFLLMFSRQKNIRYIACLCVVVNKA